MNRGDICLIEYPFTDASAAKLRPALIVSSARFNSGGDVVIIPVSSKPDADDPFSVYLDASSPQFSASGLRYPSAFKWTKPLSVSKSLFKRKLGNLAEPILSEVGHNLASMFSS